jgi:hypothetical protein
MRTRENPELGRGPESDRWVTLGKSLHSFKLKKKKNGDNNNLYLLGICENYLR